MTPGTGTPVRQRVRFGIGPLTAQDFGGGTDELATTLDAAVAAEAAGLDGVWISEHHLTGDGHIGSPLMVLAALAMRTTRLTLGTDVALAPLYHPVRLSEEASLVHRLSSGRLLLGLGTGYRDCEFSAFGVDRRERFRQLVHTVGFLRADRAVGSPSAPVTAGGQHDWPILLGGLVEPSVRRAGRLADGWIAPTLTHPRQLARRIRWLGEEGAFDRPFHVVINISVFTGDAQMCAAARRGLTAVESTYARWNAEQRDPRPAGAHQAADTPAPWVIGDAAACVDALVPWHEALEALPASAVPHLNARLHFPGVGRGPTIEAVHRFGGDVIPALRAAGGDQREDPA
jgi:alkanesulfonate monooxygenase SsuD/methylene tetrahydromethanopterin reductase-like flavin-dependent oxidoreductase (luciferase family)